MSVRPCFDDLIHAPNRLQICAMLAGVDALDFSTVREGFGVADPVVSKHVHALAEAGYVAVHKATCASRVRISLSLRKNTARSRQPCLCDRPGGW